VTNYLVACRRNESLFVVVIHISEISPHPFWHVRLGSWNLLWMVSPESRESISRSPSSSPGETGLVWTIMPIPFIT
jgi:hypothetical protein